jgi:protein ImuB
VARAGNALQLVAVDHAARARGLAAGMTLADARARCPDLASLPHDPAADARELDALGARMLRFTPQVALDPPDGLILDVTGAAHLFGGEAELARQAGHAASYTTRHALAAHAAAARALVRYGQQEHAGADVHALPVMALELPEEALSGLRRAGLATLGDLARRPTAGLAARFGAGMVARLRAILGHVDRPITPIRSPTPIRAEARFAEPITRTEHVLDVLENLLIETARQMEVRALGGQCFVATLDRSDGARRRLVVRTGLPLRDPAPVMRLFRERIETLADPLDPGFGFDRVALAIPRTEPLGARQIRLESAAEQDGNSVAALIDRLATRLGPDSVQRLQFRDTHIPEAAQRLVSAMAGTSAPWPAPWPTSSPLGAGSPIRPQFLLHPPEPIAAVASVPDGPPQRFRWRGHLHEVRLAEGPERIAPEWWRKRHGHLAGQQGLTRDYYRVEDSEGQRFWVFRHGLFTEAGHPDWYLHGFFA